MWITSRQAPPRTLDLREISFILTLPQEKNELMGKVLAHKVLAHKVLASNIINRYFALQMCSSRFFCVADHESDFLEE